MDAKVMETFESWRANVTEEDLVKELGELANQKQKISSTMHFIVHLLLVLLVFAAPLALAPTA